MKGGGEISTKDKKHGKKRKVELVDNDDSSLSIKKMEKNKKHKGEKDGEASRMVKAPTSGKSLAEESEMAEPKGMVKNRKEGKKNNQMILHNSSVVNSVGNGTREVVADDGSKKKKKKTKKEKKGTFVGTDGEKIERVRDNSDGNTEMAEKKKKKKKKSKELGVDSEAEESTVNKLCSKEVENETEQPDGTATDLDENSREDSRKKKKKKKKDKNKVRDPEAEDLEGDQRDEMPLEGVDGSSNDPIRKARKKKQHDDVGPDESTEISSKDMKKRKKKQNEDSGAEKNAMESEKDAKKIKKKKQEQSKNAQDETPSSSKSAKKVTFSDQVDVFPLSDDGGDSADEECGEDGEGEEEGENGKLVRGKRFSKKEDELVKAAVQRYIDNHGLGEEGLDMVMKCKKNPKTRHCWKEICAALPWRPRYSVYYRAHVLFEGDSSRTWTPEQLEIVKSYAEKHGRDWKTLGEVLGKHRWHVKDAWRRIRFPNMKRAKWSRVEYQTLFDLVNMDLGTKALREKNSKYGMLRDNIPWTAISDKIGTRSHVHCCHKWYRQLVSPMVSAGEWEHADDYRLLNGLRSLDAACIEDVDWDNVLEHRSGEVCRKRWNQMVLHIGLPGTKSFSDQVEILANRYCPDLAEDREAFDNRPYDDDDGGGGGGDDDDDA